MLALSYAYIHKNCLLNSSTDGGIVYIGLISAYQWEKSCTSGVAKKHYKSNQTLKEWQKHSLAKYKPFSGTLEETTAESERNPTHKPPSSAGYSDNCRYIIGCARAPFPWRATQGRFRRIPLLLLQKRIWYIPSLQNVSLLNTRV